MREENFVSLSDQICQMCYWKMGSEPGVSKFYFILFYFSSFLWVYLPQSMYVYIVYVCYIHEEANRRQKRILDPLEMEL